MSSQLCTTRETLSENETVPSSNGKQRGTSLYSCTSRVSSWGFENCFVAAEIVGSSPTSIWQYLPSKISLYCLKHPSPSSMTNQNNGNLATVVSQSGCIEGRTWWWWTRVKGFGVRHSQPASLIDRSQTSLISSPWLLSKVAWKVRA